MSQRTLLDGLNVDSLFYETVNNQYIPGTGIKVDSFWSSFSEIVGDLTPINRRLLETRLDLQRKIDAWHIERRGQAHDIRAYENFLREIGYLVDEGADFEVTTENVDTEITSTAGPQLVVPMNNARYALNAANARWGSLYDALYGTDVLPEDGGATKGSQYNPVRGTRVVAHVAHFLDQTVPLEKRRHDEVTAYQVNDG